MNNKRYTCTCDADQARVQKDTYVFGRQIVVDLPIWSKAYKVRIDQNYPATISIDSCIIDAIKDLWDKGIETTGCCCGHGYMNAFVSVDPDDYAVMYELGYDLRPVEISDEGYAMGLYTFYL